MQAERIGTQITVTPDLILAAAWIANRHPQSAITIEYREDRAENIWHVIAIDDQHEYTVDDQTGRVVAQKTPNVANAPRLSDAQRRFLGLCVMNNGWQTTGGSAVQSMARKLESYGYVELSETGVVARITDAGRERVDG